MFQKRTASIFRVEDGGSAYLENIRNTAHISMVLKISESSWAGSHW
jgi:hypothetical protein